jgi:Mrp family chromosome partitioning ATPase
MTSFDRIEQRMPELMADLASAGVPDYFDSMLQQAAATRQRPAWASLERWLPMGAVARTDTLRSPALRPILVLLLLGHVAIAGAGFDFVPVGRPVENALMLLKSAAFTRLWGQLRSRYDIVVIDSAPMLALSEAQAVCRLAKHFVVATRWRHTDTVATGEVIRRLSAMNPSFVGVVLTMVDISKYKLYAHGEAAAYYQRSRQYYSD